MGQLADPSNPTHAFIIRVGILLHRFGTPSHRLERVLTQVASSLGIQGVFLYTPTALVLSLSDETGEHTYLRRIDGGGVQVEKLIQFDDVLEKLEAGTLSIQAAQLELDAVEQAGPAHPMWLTILACAISCGAVAVFFRGSMTEIFCTLLIGLAVSVTEVLHARLRGQPGYLEPLAGLIASVSALAVAHYVTPIDDRLVTLAALIVMIPGLRITIALTELAVGHLSAGVARLAGASVTLLTMTVGVAIGWRIAGSWRDLPDVNSIEYQARMLPEYWQSIAMLIAPITFSIVFQARWPQWPVISVVSVCGFLMSKYASAEWGIEVGAFCGALTVGIGSNLYARIRDRPALVPFIPGIIVLVPGSLGYRSLTAFLENETIAGIDFAFRMMIVAVSLVGGVLTANVVMPPKRIL